MKIYRSTIKRLSSDLATQCYCFLAIRPPRPRHWVLNPLERPAQSPLLITPELATGEHDRRSLVPTASQSELQIHT